MTFNIGWDTSTNKDIFKNLLRELFDSTDREALVEYPNVVKELKVSDYYERFARQAGLEGMSELADGEAIPLADPVFDTTKDLTQVRYGLGFKITSGMKKFNKWNEMQTMTKNLGMVMKEGKDVIVARMFNNPTATTYAAGFDTLALASNSHTCLDDDATTYDNNSAGALGVSTLESALVYFDTLVDDMGMDIMATPTKLVVNPNLRITSMELLGGELKPYTGDNTINAFPDWDLKPFVYHRFTSTTTWAVIADKDPDYGLMVLTSQEPDLKVQDDVSGNTRSTVVTSEQWFDYGFTDPRRFYLGNT